MDTYLEMQFDRAIQSHLVGFFDSGNRFYWLYLLAFLALSIGLSLRYGEGKTATAKIKNFAFPNDIWMHPSARLDYWFYLVDLPIKATLLFSMVVIPPLWLAGVTEAYLTSTFGAFAYRIPDHAIPSFFFTLFLLMMYDFGFFLGHYLMHRVPLFWEFHKVHHSAEVLTPVTRYREHFVDNIITFLPRSLVFGVACGIVSYVSETPLQAGLIASAGIIFAIIDGPFGNFRHSHVAIHYPRIISKILISPVMHQAHHGNTEIYYNKNFSNLFSFWDRAFGTLYIPRKGEKISFGLKEESKKYKKLLDLYTQPFVHIYNKTTKKSGKSRTRHPS